MLHDTNPPAAPEAAPPAEPKPKLRRGFACMDPARVREIASRGGKAAHEKGTAHEFTTEEARAAGKKRGALRAKAPTEPTPES